MKIHLIKDIKDAIKGYEPILYNSSKLSVESISPNEAEFILASDILDDFSLEQISPVIQTLISKMRLNGKLVVGGTDIRVFCKSVVNNVLSEQQGSEILKTKQSMTSMSDMVKLLESLGLKVFMTQFNGMHYEITCIRN